MLFEPVFGVVTVVSRRTPALTRVQDQAVLSPGRQRAEIGLGAPLALQPPLRFPQTGVRSACPAVTDFSQPCLQNSVLNLKGNLCKRKHLKVT